MAVDKVRYVGEIVAAVAAESIEAAQKAVQGIKVKYEPIREFLNPADSLETCAPDEQIHDHTKNGKIFIRLQNYASMTLKKNLNLLIL